MRAETTIEVVERTAGVRPFGRAPRIPLVAFGMSLGSFLVISYVLCIVGYLLFPGLPIQHAAFALFPPGFELLTWRSFFLGLIESFAWGWYVALIFAPLFNFFAARIG